MTIDEKVQELAKGFFKNYIGVNLSMKMFCKVILKSYIKGYLDCKNGNPPIVEISEEDK